MRKGASGEEDVLQYKHNTKKKKTHSAHAARALFSFLPRPPLSCRLAPSAPHLEQQAKPRKRGKNGSKSGHAGAPCVGACSLPTLYSEESSAQAARPSPSRCHQALCLLKNGASP
jgi:hypothetical protein